MEHRSSTSVRHLTLFCAGPFASFHVRCFAANSAILVGHCPYIPLPDLHTRFWRQQFCRFMRHLLLRTLFQPGVNIFYPCFPIGSSGSSRTRGCSSSGLYPSTNPAWLDLPGTTLSTGTALWVFETHKIHHHGKVAAQGEAKGVLLDIDKCINER